APGSDIPGITTHSFAHGLRLVRGREAILVPWMSPSHDQTVAAPQHACPIDEARRAAATSTVRATAACGARQGGAQDVGRAHPWDGGFRAVVLNSLGESRLHLVSSEMMRGLAFREALARR